MIISCFTRWKLPTETFVSSTKTNGFTELNSPYILSILVIWIDTLLTQLEVVVPSDTHMTHLHHKVTPHCDSILPNAARRGL